jgi:hypothetical protein
MNDSSNNSINLPLQHSSNQNINIIPSPMPLRTSPPPPIPSMPLSPPPLPRISNIFSTLILQQQDPSNNIMRLWSHALFEDSDEEMVDVEENIAIENIPINNFIQTNMTIQTMNERMANWSSRHRYIPLINNFINANPEPDPDPLTRAANSLIRRSFVEDSPKYKYVLSENGKSQIELKNFNKQNFSDQLTCPITQEKFEDDQIVAQLPCKHIFEREAIMKWVQRENASCPSCRFKLDSVEEEIKKDTTSSNTTVTINNLLNFIERRELEREEEDVQRAIIASLNDINGADF